MLGGRAAGGGEDWGCGEGGSSMALEGGEGEGEGRVGDGGVEGNAGGTSADGAALITFCIANIAVLSFAPPPVRIDVQTEYGAHRDRSSTRQMKNAATGACAKLQWL